MQRLTDNKREDALELICSMLRFFDIKYLNHDIIVQAKHNQISEQNVSGWVFIQILTKEGAILEDYSWPSTHS